MGLLATIPARKALVLNRRSEHLAEHSELAEKFTLGSDRGQSEALIEELEMIHDAIDRTATPIAFAKRVVDQMPHADAVTQEIRQWDYMLAAQYGDLWSQVFDKKGRRVGAVMSYFVCLASSQWPIRNGHGQQDVGQEARRRIEAHAEVVLQLLHGWLQDEVRGRHRNHVAVLQEGPGRRMIIYARHVPGR